MKPSIKPLIMAAVTVCAALWAMPGTAHAQIFVVDDGGGNQPTPPASISDYNLDGTPISAPLLTSLAGLHGPYVMTVSGGDIFVENSLNGTIGEYTTSGTLVSASLISGFTTIWGITASGGDLFIANTGGGTVEEYTTSGTPVSLSLITGLAGPYNIAVSGGDIFVGNGQSISEYTTSGTLVKAAVVSGLSGQFDFAESGGNLFVADGGVISEYTTSGTLLNGSLISGSSGSAPDIAVSGGDLYFVTDSDTIAEYTTSGTPVNTSLISGLGAPGLLGVVVVPVPEPSTLALAGLSGLSLLLFRRRRNKPSVFHHWPGQAWLNSLATAADYCGLG